MVLAISSTGTDPTRRIYSGQTLVLRMSAMQEVIKVKNEPHIVYHSTLLFMFCSDTTHMFMNLCPCQ